MQIAAVSHLTSHHGKLSLLSGQMLHKLGLSERKL
jgi:hypothetical protein